MELCFSWWWHQSGTSPWKASHGCEVKEKAC